MDEDLETRAQALTPAEVVAWRQDISCDAVLEAHAICENMLQQLLAHRAELPPEMEQMRGQVLRLNLLAGLAYAAIKETEGEMSLDDMHREFHGVPRPAGDEVRS